MNEILAEEKDDYQNISRIDEHKFIELTNLVVPRIRSKGTKLCKGASTRTAI